MSEKKSLLEMLPKGQIFMLGAVVSFFAITSIGFFVLLSQQVASPDTIEPVVARGDAQQGVPSAVVPPSDTNIVLTPVTDADWYKGKKDADITIVEFSDTECPFCKRFHDTMNQVIATYGDSVKWVYRHAPLDSLHSKARREALALECAGDLEGNTGFWKFADELFARTPSNNELADAELFSIAKDTGVNVAAFTDCLDSKKFAGNVQEDLDDGQKAGLRGTPYSVLLVGDQKIVISGAQPLSQVEQIIQSVIK